jgi:hypothetical protein
MPTSAHAFQHALLAAALEEMRQRSGPACLVCGQENPRLTGAFSCGFDTDVPGRLLAPPGLVRIFFYRLCRSCQQTLSEDRTLVSEHLMRGILGLEGQTDIAIVDVDPEVFAAWRDSGA